MRFTYGINRYSKKIKELLYSTSLGSDDLYQTANLDTGAMSAILTRVFRSSYYLHKVQHDTTVLHYKRSPTWRSLVLFTGENLDCHAKFKLCGHATSIFFLFYSSFCSDTLHINTSW